jgi:hypothetical protein
MCRGWVINGSFYYLAVSLVKDLKQWGLGLRNGSPAEMDYGCGDILNAN